MSNKKVYIAGKVSGLPRLEVVVKFGKAQKQIESLGFEAVNPTVVVPSPKMPWGPAMKLCIKALMDCNYILELDCCQDSKGAK